MILGIRNFTLGMAFHDLSKRKPQFFLGTFKQGVSKQGVMTFAWRPGSQYDASDCRAQFGRPSTRNGCRICLTVRLPVRPRGDTTGKQIRIPTFPFPPFECALNSRSNSRSDSRNWWEPTWKFFICLCVLGFLGWSPAHQICTKPPGRAPKYRTKGCSRY